MRVSILVALLNMAVTALFGQEYYGYNFSSLISRDTRVAVLPYCATHSCGMSYITWFAPDPASGDFHPWIQLIDDRGNFAWPHAIRVSHHSSMSWITDYSLAVTPDTAAIVSFQDIRTGNNDIFIYKTDRSGKSVWGTDGIQLSYDDGFDTNPVMAVHADGSVVVAWTLGPPEGRQRIYMQKLDRDGARLWGEGVAVESSSFDCTSPKIVAVEDGSTILVWYKESGPTWAPKRILCARKVNADGEPSWVDDAVMFSGAMPLYVTPSVASDGEGGVFVLWSHEASPYRLSGRISHVDGNGVVTMPGEGVELSENASVTILDPVLGIDPGDHSAYVFWRATDMHRAQYRLGGQRIATGGQKLWGPDGKTFGTPGSANVSLLTVNGINGGAVLGYSVKNPTSNNESQVLSLRIDSSGAELLETRDFTVVSESSWKKSLSNSPLFNGRILYTWEEIRNGASQVFAAGMKVDMSSQTVDDSFILSPDTLWFLTGSDFVEGKPFQIINPHAHPIDIQHIDQFGVPCPTCIPWYTYPNYPSFPLNIPAGGNITTLVKFYAIDAPQTPMVFDTLAVNTAGHSGHVIIAADSMMVQVDVPETGSDVFSAAPNPFIDFVRISLSGNAGENVVLTVSDAMMRTVATIHEGPLMSESPRLGWSARGVAPGVYFINLMQGSGTRTLKVIKLMDM